MIEEFKMRLDWNNEADGTFFDRQGVSLLDYAVCLNNLEVTKYILEEISKNFGDNRSRRFRVINRLQEEFLSNLSKPRSIIYSMQKAMW